MKRIPRIKFPERHAKPSGPEAKLQAASTTNEVDTTFFSKLKAPKTVVGKASLQPNRTPVSKEEIEAILNEAVHQTQVYAGIAKVPEHKILDSSLVDLSLVVQVPQAQKL